MRNRILTLVAIGAALLAGQAVAQPPNPLDAIPDKMPFDIPYGAPVSLEQADALINAAIA